MTHLPPRVDLILQLLRHLILIGEEVVRNKFRFLNEGHRRLHNCIMLHILVVGDDGARRSQVHAKLLVGALLRRPNWLL